MTKPACPRLFEVEAVRDGRLGGAEGLSFQRHLASCPRCAREFAELQTLGRHLRDSGSEADADELHVRRERTRLLAAFDAKLAPPERTPAARGWLFGVAAASLLAFGGLLFFHLRGGLPAATQSAVVVRANGEASWSRRSEGGLEKVLLERGALSIRVDHAVDRRRLLVVLPDGELEDIGTQFVVSAEAGRTTGVSVQSGSVVLRIRGQAPLSLSAGASWSPSRPAAAANCPSCNPGSEPDPSSSPLPPASAASPAPLTTMRSKRAATASTALSARSALPPPKAADPQSDPALDFRAAMTALDGGSHIVAAARFASFINAHPSDARCEDAAYLRVIALQRAGDDTHMRAAAAEYLRHYPAGFRHAEVAALTR